MKTSWKIAITIFLFFLLDSIAVYILYTKAWTRFYRPTILTNSNNSTQKFTATKTYTNAQMHMSFNYPKNLEIKQISPSLISLENPLSTATDSSLFIFETTITTNQNIVGIPFVTKGKIKTQAAIPVLSFTAKQITYTDGLVLITLRKNDQFIMIRIPKNSQYVEEAINDVVNTITSVQ